jgi:hypothetical protein
MRAKVMKEDYCNLYLFFFFARQALFFFLLSPHALIAQNDKIDVYSYVLYNIRTRRTRSTDAELACTTRDGILSLISSSRVTYRLSESSDMCHVVLRVLLYSSIARTHFSNDGRGAQNDAYFAFFFPFPPRPIAAWHV